MKRFVCIVCVTGLLTASPARSEGQTPIFEIIKKAVTKVIKAIDLKIQRLQTKTIWLQNAQKEVENEMSKLKLQDISGWVKKQKDLYENYFRELWNVKEAISTYYKVSDIIKQQLELVNEYHSAYTYFRQNGNFTADELIYMQHVYSGILGESVKNLDEVYLVVNAFVTQMSDAKRLGIINDASNKIVRNLTDLRQFNERNKLLSMQRSLEKGNIDVMKSLYGF